MFLLDSDQKSRANPAVSSIRLDDGWENVILCVTTENQKRADERLPILLDIPAKHKLFMIAPILSEVHVESYLATKQFEQVLCDGENYDGNRPCRYEWVKSLHDQCEKENVRFDFIGTGNVFVKDGKVYCIPKAYQSVQAKRSGLSYPSGETDVPIQPRCKTCKRRYSCNGCHWCGKMWRKMKSITSYCMLMSHISGVKLFQNWSWNTCFKLEFKKKRKQMIGC